MSRLCESFVLAKLGSCIGEQEPLLLCQRFVQHDSLFGVIFLLFLFGIVFEVFCFVLLSLVYNVYSVLVFFPRNTYYGVTTMLFDVLVSYCTFGSTKYTKYCLLKGFGFFI